MRHQTAALATSDHGILDPFITAGSVGSDGLCLAAVPFVPEVRLHLAEDAILLRARLEARVGQALPAPFWADAWAGGQALARYVLDNPGVVAGRQVLDVASGSGLVAIAAATAGAREVTANDIDPYSVAAIALNARTNDAAITVDRTDLLDGDGGAAEVVLAGDVFYTDSLADRMLAFLRRAATRGARVLIGDPGRTHLPHDRLDVVATYSVSGLGAPVDAQLSQVHVLALRP